MPKWLQKQMMQAYFLKDRHQILFLNRCWFEYWSKELERRKREEGELDKGKEK